MKSRSAASILLAVLTILASAATCARAAMLEVDTTLDDIAKAGCADETPDDCSLRGAVAKANGDAAHDTIVVPAGTYTLSVAGPCFFAAAAGDSVNGFPVVAICLNSDIDLVGAGANETTIQSNGTDRVFAVSRLKTVSISGVTLSGGRGGFGFAIGGGGGVNNHGTLTVADSIVTNNQSHNGGGLYNLGTLTVLRSTITGNAANTGGAGGGGINNVCCGGALTVTVIDSTISANSAHLGAGINNNGFVTVLGSTIAGNNANVGGGIYNGGGQVTVRNSTISGNSGLGAGIDNGRSSPDGASRLRLENVTITKNASTSGGGFYITGNQPVTLRNTIVAGNTSSQSFGPDCAGRITSEGYNLIQSLNQCQIVGDTTGNVTGVPARLGDLANNGGPTRTHAPLGASGTTPASPAIEAGNPADPASGGTACLAIDQRGVLRPIGARCDIGAFERGASLSIASVSPSRVGNTGPVLAEVAGSSFDAGATVKLTRDGEADVVGSPVHVESAGASLAASFDLTDCALGAWDVVVTNEDDTSVTLEGALTVEPVREPQLWAGIVGRSAIRPGVPVRFSVVYGNRGNVDAVGVPLSISYPKDFLFDLVSPLLPPPASASQATLDWRLVPILVGVAPESDVSNIPLLLPIVPVGFIGAVDFVITLPAGTAHGAEFELSTKIEPQPWLRDETTLEEAVTDLVDGAGAYATRSFSTTAPPHVEEAAATYGRMQLEAIAEAGRDEVVSRLGRTGSIYSPAQLTIDVAAFMREQTLMASRSQPGWDEVLACVVALGSLAAPESAQANTPCVCICGQPIPEGCSCGSCDKPYLPPGGPPNPGGLTPSECNDLPNHKVSADGKFCIPKNTKDCPKGGGLAVAGGPDCLTIPIRSSVDPNDKTPSPGAGPANVVTGDEPLKYGISFENLPTATAAAQVVTITDQLDTESLDLSTFAFGPIAIADQVTIVPPASGVSAFTGGADLRPGVDLIVRVDAHLDPVTGIATWTFISIDPATGQLTDDPLAGFLPPNMNPPEGEGRVLYTVSAKPSVPTGTVIKNKASIVFDVNEAIETPEVSNVIDRTAPASAVTSAGASGCGTELTVEWSGTDQGSAIQDYSIFVSTDGGPFAVWLADTAETSAVFPGETGRSYGFYSVARDIVGNAEAAPDEADVTHSAALCGNEHDLAVTGLKVAKTAKLTAKKPARSVVVTVLLQNRSRHPETIPDVATLSSLASLEVESLGDCADPVATYRPPRKPKAITWKPGKKLKLLFDMTIDCANDPAKGAADYAFTARAHHTALGAPDDHAADDVCPRDVAPPGVLDPIPAKAVLDKGCGVKKPDKTFGGMVVLDVLVR